VVIVDSNLQSVDETLEVVDLVPVVVGTGSVLGDMKPLHLGAKLSHSWSVREGTTGKGHETCAKCA